MEGEIIHIIVEKVNDHTYLLDQVEAIAFLHRPGREYGATQE